MADDATTPTTSFDVFKTYFSALFDNVDLESPWLRDLYNAAQKYYTQGIDDSFIPDLLLSDENAPQSYKDRFAGIFELKRRQAAGENISYIPSVAEYSKMTVDLRKEFAKYGLQELGTDSAIAKIIGSDVDLSEVQERLSTVFMAIDNADQYLKNELSSSFPMLSRTDLAKALLTGTDGAKELQKKIDIAGVKASATEFGVNAQFSAEEAVKMGVSRQGARQAYEKTALELGGIQQSANMFGDTMGGLAKDVEESNLLQKESGRVRKLKSQARSQFSGQTGVRTGTLRKKAAGQI
jgi:hypothetical protein